ncbi:MAG: DNRLRE domain-containing protein [Chloroflexi bacterium]|nr:MAG: DNRLRE domain-containing protein [Chloroflexota bacterium]
MGGIGGTKLPGSVALQHSERVGYLRLTLYEFGNSGTKGKTVPSLIQVASVSEGWDPATLAWNNAPLVKENISTTVVNIMPGAIIYPGQPYTWDVSKALADAYAAGQPLRLVFYSSDSAYNTGKYFFSSTIPDWNATGRPTLQATLGTIATSSSAPFQSSGSLAAVTPAPLFFLLWTLRRRKLIKQG